MTDVELGAAPSVSKQNGMLDIVLDIMLDMSNMGLKNSLSEQGFTRLHRNIEKLYCLDFEKGMLDMSNTMSNTMSNKTQQTRRNT